jgi:hypothetical protein
LVRVFRLLVLVFVSLSCLIFGILGQKQASGQTGAGQVERAGDRVNPFLTRKEEKALVELGDIIPLEYLKVSAIFYSEQTSRSQAIIDGKVLVLGDNIDNKEIIKINPEDVVLEDSQGKYVAKMSGVVVNTVKSE